MSAVERLNSEQILRFLKNAHPGELLDALIAFDKAAAVTIKGSIVSLVDDGDEFDVRKVQEGVDFSYLT